MYGENYKEYLLFCLLRYVKIRFFMYISIVIKKIIIFNYKKLVYVCKIIGKDGWDFFLKF